MRGKLFLRSSGVAQEEKAEDAEWCTRCGAEAAGAAGEEVLCVDCFQASGSCCGFSENG